MAERKVNGKDMLLFLDLAGGTAYDLVVCLTNNSFKIATDIIDAKSKCGADSAPGTTSYEVGFEGQIIEVPDTDRVGMYLLLTAAQNKTTVGWKIARAGTAATGDIVRAGTGFVASVDENFELEGVATFSATLGITSAYDNINSLIYEFYNNRNRWQRKNIKV